MPSILWPPPSLGPWNSPSAANESGQKQNHMGKFYVLSLEVLLLTLSSSVKQNLVPRPHLTGREAGKCNTARGRGTGWKVASQSLLQYLLSTLSYMIQKREVVGFACIFFGFVTVVGC